MNQNYLPVVFISALFFVVVTFPTTVAASPLHHFAQNPSFFERLITPFFSDPDTQTQQVEPVPPSIVSPPQHTEQSEETSTSFEQKTTAAPQQTSATSDMSGSESGSVSPPQAIIPQSDIIVGTSERNYLSRTSGVISNTPAMPVSYDTSPLLSTRQSRFTLFAASAALIIGMVLTFAGTLSERQKANLLLIYNRHNRANAHI